jgi:hypothetical protein
VAGPTAPGMGAAVPAMAASDGDRSRSRRSRRRARPCATFVISAFTARHPFHEGLTDIARFRV